MTRLTLLQERLKQIQSAVALLPLGGKSRRDLEMMMEAAKTEMETHAATVALGSFTSPVSRQTPFLEEMDKLNA